MLFSVIIPTKDRRTSLDRCLHALRALSFPHEDFEVIVVDDGSHSPIDELIASHQPHLPVRLYKQTNRGPAVARNLGIRNATGQVIVLTDDDCRPEPGWLAAYKTAFSNQPVSAWGGAIDPAPESSLYGVAAQLLVTYLYQVAPSHLRFYCTNNVAFPRQELLEIGGFDEGFPLAAAEDRDLCDRWSKHHPISFAPLARVTHSQRLSLAAYCRQQFRYGRGAFHYHQRRRQRGDSPLRVETFRFYRRLLTFPWRSEPIHRAAPLTALLALAQFANFCGYAWERSR